ncbi:MAG: hypothetical protein H6825_08405 [Planctomycetes bacterium]|nr:hypothetical protein [Planctomycetota bacterium]
MVVLLCAFGCAAGGNLDERPGWAQGFEQWKGAKAGQPGLMGSLIEQHQDTPQQLFARYPEDKYLFVVGEGRAPRGKPGDAKRNAQKDAQAELANMLWVAVSSEMSLDASSTQRDGSSSSSERLDESVRTFSASVLSDMSVAREWYGYEGDDEVAYVLMALDRGASARNLADLVGQDVAAARTLVGEIDQELASGELAGVPVQVADLSMRSDRLRAGLLALGVLDGGRTAADVRDEVASIGADSTRLRLDVLENVTPSELPTLPYVRGRDEPVLGLRLLLPLAGRMQPVSSCPLIVHAPDRPVQRVRTDPDGRLTLPLALASDTARGEYAVEVTYDLCRDHKDGGAAGCTCCTLQQQFAFRVPYRVVPDEQAFDASFASAEQAFEEGRWTDARQAYAEAGRLVFDVPDESARCDGRLREVSLEITLEDAGGMLESNQFADALDAYASAWSGLELVPDGSRRGPAIRDGGLAAALGYSGEQRAAGDDASRERCLERVLGAEQMWDAPDLRVEIAGLKEVLPCVTCGRSGRCPTCLGSAQPGMVLADCATCEGRGTLPHDCPQCANGFVACTHCAEAGLKVCPDCKGTWSKTHSKCDGKGCKKCQNGKVLCKTCAYCKVHKAYADSCVTPGKVPAKCKVCGGDGKVRCKNCQAGPLVFAGTEWKGYVLATCPACDGTRKRLAPCPARCDSGVCPTCHGVAHRV